MKIIVAAIAVALLAGCVTPNKLNSEWKESLAQLQITPVMPLRGSLEVGEVYRYLKKPKKFYTDDQLEPVLAFRLEGLPDVEKGARTWPTFKFKGGSDSSVSAVSSAAGILSANLNTTDTLNITVTKGHSIRIPSSAIIEEFFDVTLNNEKRPILTVKSKYQGDIRAIAALNWNSWFWEYSRNLVYLRIPVEVYYAEELNVTAHKTSKAGGDLKIPNETQLAGATGNVKVAVNSDSTVSLVEKFQQPMAIGYRAMVVRVWSDSMLAREFPEDSGNQFWNGL